MTQPPQDHPTDAGNPEDDMVQPSLEPAASNSKLIVQGGFRVLRELAITLALALLVFVLVQSTVRNYRVDGFSMEPTLVNGQLLIVNRITYARLALGRWGQNVPFLDSDKDGWAQPFGHPQNGDVVVLRSPAQAGVNLVKRVMGVPGDTVELRRGVVFVNGKAVDESKYIERPGNFNMGPTKLGAEQYWVMGDNRIASSDSRFFGSVPRENITGKAWMRYWPWSSFGFIKAHWLEDA